MHIVAVTVDYSRHADTLECVDSLLKSRYEDLSILVVDNGSDEPLRLARKEPNVTVIRMTTNLGFAGGFNVGMRHAIGMGAEAVLILNNDTIAAENMVTLLAAELKSGVGIVAPRIYYRDDPHRIWSDGFKAGPLTLDMRNDRRGRLDSAVVSVPVRNVDYVPGCAMLIHRKALDSVGLFDEQFFAYYEDLDYCIRVRRAGFRILAVSEALLWHKVAGTTGLQSPRRQYLIAYSSVRFFAKHAGWRWPFIVIARAVSLGKTLVTLAVARRGDLIQSHVRGLAEGLHDTFVG
jgi:GT2 family glycosyltransferase